MGTVAGRRAMEAARFTRARLEPPAVRAITRDRVDRLLDRAWDGPAHGRRRSRRRRQDDGGRAPRAAQRATPPSGTGPTPSTPTGGASASTSAQAVAHRTGEPAGWPTLTEFAVAPRADRRRTRPLLIVIDEFDALIGTDDRASPGPIRRRPPPLLHLVTLSRHRPSFNLARMRLADRICEIGPDDLRFRSWEVDRSVPRSVRAAASAGRGRRAGTENRWVGGRLAVVPSRHGSPPGRSAPGHDRPRRSAGRPRLGLPGRERAVGAPRRSSSTSCSRPCRFERLTADLCDDLRAATDSGQLPGPARTVATDHDCSMEAPGSFRPPRGPARPRRRVAA